MDAGPNYDTDEEFARDDVITLERPDALQMMPQIPAPGYAVGDAENIFDPSSRSLVNQVPSRPDQTDIIAGRNANPPREADVQLLHANPTRYRKPVVEPAILPWNINNKEGNRASMGNVSRLNMHLSKLLNDNRPEVRQTGGDREVRALEVKYPQQLRFLWRAGLGRDEDDIVTTQDFKWCEDNRREENIVIGMAVTMHDGLVIIMVQIPLFCFLQGEAVQLHHEIPAQTHIRADRGIGSE